MNALEAYFCQNTGRLIHKWHHYFEVYERHFARFAGKPVVIVEIGVYHGGSLQMWKHYFGKEARIFGIDIDPRCKALEEDNIRIFTGSQADRRFLRETLQSIPPIDILIDDGGHTMRQQIISFEEMFRHVKPDGVYLCEDCHTSYWPEYGGGFRRRGTFIEYSKNWIDYLHAWHARSPRLKVNDFTRSVKSIHYYDSIVVLEKGVVEAPEVSKTGTPSFPDVVPHKALFRLVLSAGRKIFNGLSAALRLPFHVD